ncbi:MAG: hypothetical protein LBU32_20780 [Clostridiales bacterium]|nr:hypothetical protein [Clostridiales bacterium]
MRLDHVFNPLPVGRMAASSCSAHENCAPAQGEKPHQKGAGAPDEQDASSLGISPASIRAACSSHSPAGGTGRDLSVSYLGWTPQGAL